MLVDRHCIFTFGLLSSHDITDQFYLKLHVTYYDNVTPEDYQPEGFKDASEEERDLFACKATTFKVGAIETPFHGYVV